MMDDNLDVQRQAVFLQVGISSNLYYLNKKKPTVTGLIRMPSSLCAVSGESRIFVTNILLLHSVFTKVERPIPDAPGQNRKIYFIVKKKIVMSELRHLPTTIRVNWKPFLKTMLMSYLK